jgi:hypothetical protein
VMTIKSIIIWDVKLCGLAEACRLSEEPTALSLTTDALCSLESSKIPPGYTAPYS